MGLLSAASNPTYFVALAVAFVVAITIHEFLHAWAADRLGDPTPRSAGRVTLNPLRHLDPMGTLLLVIVGFGWGRPVMVNPRNFRTGARSGMALVAAAGPASNLVLAFGLAPLLRGLDEGLTIGSGVDSTLALFIVAAIQINIILALFNMIPVPPLDGFSVLTGIVPQQIGEQLERLRRYGPFALMAVLIAGPFLGLNIIGFLLGGPIAAMYNLLLPI